MSTPAVVDPAVEKAIRKAGIEKLVAERQEAHFSIKELQARVDKLSSQILGLMLKFDVAKLQVGEFPVAAVTDGTYTKFDYEGFKRYLIEARVSPKLVAKAEAKFRTQEPKKPFIRIGVGAGGSEE